MQSVRESVDWTLEDNVVDALFFRATLTGRRGIRTPFVQIWAETPDAEVVKSDPGSSGEGRFEGVGAGVGDENTEFCGVVRPLRIALVVRPMRRTYVLPSKAR